MPRTCRRFRQRQANTFIRMVETLEARLFLAAHIAGSSTTYSTIQSAVSAASTEQRLRSTPALTRNKLPFRNR